MMLEEANMTTSSYAPTPSATFPSIYGQPGIYGQTGYEQPIQSPYGVTPQLPGQQLFGQSGTGFGLPQQFGGQQFGGQQFGPAQQQFNPAQQFGGQQQFGGPEQIGVIVQALPQLLWAAQQNLAAAQHLTQQVMQQIAQFYQRSGSGDSPWARQSSRQYGMAW
jgi:hypothetical protein